MAADVKIKLIIDDSGALQTLKEFNKAVQQIASAQKGLNKQFNRTFSNVSKKAKVARDNFKQLGIVAKNGMKKTEVATRRTRKEMDLLQRTGASIKNVFAGVFIADTLRSAINGIKRAIVGSINEFREYEKALVGVGKTANLTGFELNTLGDAIKELDIPVPNVDLLNLAKVAGQLGIKGRQNILKFTETMAKLQVATDVAGEQGAASLARILNVTNESADSVDILGSVLVSLGNNFAATESEILRVTTELARSAGQFGITSAEATAFGAAMKSLGIQAEGGGTAVGRVFRQLNKATAEGGPLLKNFAKIMGITQEELQNMFASNPTDAVVKFLDALNKGTQSGLNMGLALKSVKLDTDRVAKVVPVLAGRVDELHRALGLANLELKNTRALNEEAGRAFDTLDGDIDAAKKNVSSLATELVEVLSPALRATLQGFTGFTQSLRRGLRDTATSTVPELKDSLEGVDETLRNLNQEASLLGKNFERGKSGITIQDDINKVLKDREKILARLRALGEEVNVTGGVEEDLLNEKALLRQFALEKQKEDAQKEVNIVKQKEQEKLSIEQLFIELKKQRDSENKEEQRVLSEIATNEEFARLQEAFGQEEALDIAFKAQELERQGKHDKAIELLRQKDIDAQKKIKKQSVDLEQRTANAKVGILQAFSNLAGSVAEDGSKELFLIQKAAALAATFVAGQQATAMALAVPPAPNIPLAKLTAAAANINLAAIAGSAIKGFEEGGVVPGSSFSGDNVPARVNSGEMILTRQQQANLFAQANGQGGNGSQEINTHITVQLDEEVVAKAVSRQVANGFELGEQT